MPRNWPAAMDRRLLKLYAEGAGLHEMAAELAAAPEEVNQRLRELARRPVDADRRLNR